MIEYRVRCDADPQQFVTLELAWAVREVRWRDEAHSGCRGHEIELRIVTDWLSCAEAFMWPR